MILQPEVDAQCPLCATSKAVAIFAFGRLVPPREGRPMRYRPMTTVLCTNCGLLYRYPVASDEEMRSYYERGYYEEYQDESAVQPAELAIATQKNRNLLTYLRAHIDFQDKIVLDAGCGRALLLSQIAAIGQARSLLGLEPSAAMVDWCKMQNYPFPVVQGVMSEFAETTQHNVFHVILLVGVLEHLANPRRELAALRQLIAPDGIMYIYTHNEYPTVDWNPAERISLVHVIYLTELTIRQLLAAVGFEVVQLVTHGTGMGVFARPSPIVASVPSLPQDKVRVLYDRYQRSMSRQASSVRQLRRGLRWLAAIPRRTARRVLQPWLPKLKSYRRKNRWW